MVNDGENDVIHNDMGVSSSSWGYPNSWMVYFRENANLKWMMTGGTPIYENPHVYLKKNTYE